MSKHPVTNNYVLPNTLNSLNVSSNNFELVSEVGDTVPQTLQINKLSLQEIKVNKLSRYVFPNKDYGPTSAGKIEIPTIESLKYITNLSCHKLNPDLKTIYDNICGRDVSFPEISENGMLTTKYDIKAECAKYKKAQEKIDYVKSLS